MTIQQMKDAIANVYKTSSWRKKVSNMYDDQVIAIYHNFYNRGILNKVLRRERPATINKRKQEDKYQQLTIFDLTNEQERGV